MERHRDSNRKCKTSSLIPELLDLLVTHEIRVHREPQLSHSWISLAMRYLSASSPSSCSIRWRQQCQLVSQKTRWQSTRIRSCSFLQDIKKIVPSTHGLHSVVWQSLLILPAFLQERVVFPSYLIFSFYNKNNSSSTPAVLWQAASLMVPGTKTSPQKPEPRCYRAMSSSQASLNVPLQAASRPWGWAWSHSGNRRHTSHGGYKYRWKNLSFISGYDGSLRARQATSLVPYPHWRRKWNQVGKKGHLRGISLRLYLLL